MTSYSINLLFINEPQCLESSLHTLLVAMSGKLSDCQEQPLFFGLCSVNREIMHTSHTLCRLAPKKHLACPDVAKMLKLSVHR